MESASAVPDDMTEQKTPYPNDLWNMLLDLDQRKFSGAMPDIDMIHRAFKKQPERKESIIAKSAFESAMNNWSDAQIHEFALYVFEEKLSAEITSTQLHLGLKMLYQKIFEL